MAGAVNVQLAITAEITCRLLLRDLVCLRVDRPVYQVHELCTSTSIKDAFDHLRSTDVRRRALSESSNLGHVEIRATLQATVRPGFPRSGMSIVENELVRVRAWIRLKQSSEV